MVSEGCRKGRCHSSSEIAGDYRLNSLTSVPRKVMEQIHLEVVSKLMKDRKVIGSSQYRFTNSKSHLTSLILFYDEVTGATDQGIFYALILLGSLKQFLMLLSPNWCVEAG